MITPDKNITVSEVIRLIETDYGSHYDPTSPLSAWDQLEICESIAQSSSLTENKERLLNPNVNAAVNGRVNDSYKRCVNFELTARKRQIITQLEACRYRTSPREIARFLEEFFQEWPSYDGYWLSVAQRWPPRPICRVIQKIINQQNAGWTTVRNPAKLFSYLIQKRAIRKRRL